MPYSTKTKGIALSLVHLLMGVVSIVFGVVSIKLEEADYNKGLYGMGIWLGIWMLITCLWGLFTASSQPAIKCRITCFIGFSCYSIVAMMVCCIPLIVGPVNHFSFESKANKEYYRIYGPESMYHRPMSYFDERNRIGRIGCAIYGSLLCVILLDIIVAVASCFIWKQALNTLMDSRRQQRQHIVAGSLNTGYNHSISFLSPAGYLQDGFIIDSQCLHPKLPSYRDIYPDGSPAWENQPTIVPSTNQPPPPYNETISSQDEHYNEPTSDASGTVNVPFEDPPILNAPINDMDNCTMSRNSITTSNATLQGDPPLSYGVPLEGTLLSSTTNNSANTHPGTPTLSSLPVEDTSESSLRNGNTSPSGPHEDPPLSTGSQNVPPPAALMPEHPTISIPCKDQPS